MFARVLAAIKSLFIHETVQSQPEVKPEVKEVDADGYTEDDRMIFKYYTGKANGWVSKDPMPLWKKVMDVKPKLSIAMSLSLSQHSESQKGHDDVVKITREIFGVTPFEEGGLTEIETVDLLNGFLDWCGVSKKNSRVSATLQQETSTTPKPEQAESSPTPNTSDSGSTEKEPTKEEPPTSSTVCESLSEK